MPSKTSSDEAVRVRGRVQLKMKLWNARKGKKMEKER